MRNFGFELLSQPQFFCAMRFLPLLFLFFLPHTFFAQWKPVGAASGFPANEAAIEITPGGQLYLASINPNNNKRFNVRKWVNNTWEIIGIPDFGNGGYFSLQLVTVGENTVYVAAKRLNGNNQLIEVYKYTPETNGWTALTFGEPLQTNHTYDFSLQVTPADEPILTFYNQSNAFDQFSVVVVNLFNGQQLLSYTPALLTGVGNALSSQVTSATDITVVLEQNALLELTSSLPLLRYNGTSWTNYQAAADNALSLKTAKSGELLSTIWLTDNFTPELKFRTMNGTTLGQVLVIPQETGSGSIAGYDLDMQGSTAFLFYRNDATCFFSQIASPMSPAVTTISSGTSLAPGTATSLSTDTHNDIHVIAYVENNRCYVKEYDRPAEISSSGSYSLCEGAAFNNHGNPALHSTDPNFDHSNISMTCASQNTSVLPQSAVSVSGDGLSWNLNIGTTNNIPATTIVDLQWTLHENGVPIGTRLTPVSIYSNPNIQISFADTDFCENENSLLLAGKATPYGGNWSGTGVTGNSFQPNAFDPAPSTLSYLYYTRTNSYGCTSSDSVLVTIHQSPELTISATPADCGASNGTAAVSITGGIPSYTTYWSNGTFATSINELAPGNYQVYVTDEQGCSSKSIASVATNTFTLNSAVTNVSCTNGTNGAIDLVVTEGTAPFTYSWSNGAETQDLSGLVAGSYEVTVNDAEGCTSSANFTIAEPEALAFSTEFSLPACGENDGSVSLEVTGGTSPNAYEWRDENNQSVGENAILSGIPAGFYTCHITDQAGCTASYPVAVSNQNAPEVVIHAVTSSSCDNDGSIQLTDVSGLVTAFAWSNGATGSQVNGLAPGLYTVKASDANDCATILSATVVPIMPETPLICFVTVDTLTNTNLVVWEKPVTTAIDHFNIYRESSNHYQLVGSVDYDDEAIFNDLAVSAGTHSRRYRITAVNTCDIESEQSMPHKSMHLNASNGLGDNVNLSWNGYEGLSYSGFIVRRHTDLDGWQTLEVMPTNLYTYTDQPPTRDGLAYVIAIELPEACGDQPFSFSNKDQHLATVLSTDELSDDELRVFPNPSTGAIQVENTGNESLEAAVYDAFGREVASFSAAPGRTQTDLSTLSDGLYQLVFTTGNQSTVRKLVIRH